MPAITVTELDRALGPGMFWLALCYLGALSGWLFADWNHAFHLVALLALHPLFLAEACAHAVTGRRVFPRDLAACLFPPLRLGGRDHRCGTCVWLPRIGWAHVQSQLAHRVETAFSVPMILIALGALPLLGFEYYLWVSQREPTWHLVAFLRLSESIIWVAFALEFIVMIAIVPQRLRYCQQHWIDIAIICLPLVGCLRVFRLGRALRLHQISKVGRVYRLRGLSSRMFRGVLLINIVRRLREVDPQERLTLLRQRLVEAEAEVDQLRAEIRTLEEEAAGRAAPPADA